MSNDHYSVSASRPLRHSLRLLNVGTARYTGDWHSVPHTHSYAELFYVVGGEGHIQIDHELYPVSQRQLVIINPNITHTEVSRNASPLEYVVLGIEGLELSLDLANESHFQILDPQDTGGIYSCIQSILQESHAKLPGSDTICQAYMEILVTRLMRITDFSLNRDPLPSSNNQCAVVRRYIDAHFKEPLTLDKLAQVANVNKYHLAHSFKEEFGISPITYQLHRRIEESCYLLRQTDMTLAEIARILGFSSSSYFSQLFRKYRHQTPSAYRRTPTDPT